MTRTDARRELDSWLQKADTLLEEEGRAAVVDEDTLGPRTVVGRRNRLVLERDLELHVGRSTVLGEQFVAIGLWQPSSRRYRDEVRLPSHRLGDLIGQLSGLRRFAGRCKVTAYAVCGTCHSVRGGPIGSLDGVQVHQLCHCATADEHADQPRIFDHNTKFELCRCCAVEALQSGSRWSVWFCGECKPRITALNQRSGRCVVPIGRHSLMNGVFFDRGANGGVRAFADQLTTLFAEMGGTEGWARAAVRLNLAAAGLPVDEDIDLGTYLAAVAASPSVRKQRFTQMIESLSRRARRKGPGQTDSHRHLGAPAPRAVPAIMPPAARPPATRTDRHTPPGG